MKSICLWSVLFNVENSISEHFFFFFIQSKYYSCLLRTAPVPRGKNVIKTFCKSKRRFSDKSRGKMQKANGRGKHRGKFNPLNHTSFLGFICTRPLVKQLYFYIKIFFRQNKLHIINMDFINVAPHFLS